MKNFFLYLIVGFSIGTVIAMVLTLMAPNPKGWVSKSYSDICKPQYFNGQNIDLALDHKPDYEGQESERVTVCVDKGGHNPTFRTAYGKTFVLVDQTMGTIHK